MKNKKGEGYVSTCVMIVVICMLLSVFVTFAVAVNTVKTVERNSRVVLDSFVMQNSIEIYDSIKKGNNETNEIDADEYREALSDFCTLVKSGSRYYNYDSDGETNFYISKPYVGFTEQNKLKIYASYRVYIPIRFAGVWVTTAVVPITVESKFNERF